MREGLKWQRERDWFVSDLMVATWTWWVDLKVAARSRSGSLTGWSDLGMGCSHDGQIGSRVGCSLRSGSGVGRSLGRWRWGMGRRSGMGRWGWRMGRRSTLSLLGLRDGSYFSGCESSKDGSSCSIRTHVFSLSLSLSLSLRVSVSPKIIWR